jgi:hypothetical protein
MRFSNPLDSRHHMQPVATLIDQQIIRRLFSGDGKINAIVWSFIGHSYLDLICYQNFQIDKSVFVL